MIPLSPDISDAAMHWDPITGSKLSPESPWWPWVSDPGSLTKRLKAQSDGKFAVQVDVEQWRSDLPLAVRSLFGPLAATHQFWSRKVTLLGCDTPWVKAHTLIPAHSLLSPLKTVMELKNQPLGEYLFDHPDLVRGAMDVTLLGRDIWGRRSLFYLFGKPILVAEFFLPALLEKSM
ncbi:MAG: chorismate--pyruvate lyase [Pseudohongiellaceae bacterium]